MKYSSLKVISLLALSCLLSCVNQEYDLNKIEVDEISALEGLPLPLGSSKIFKIADVLDVADSNEALKTDDEGNFYLSFGDDDIFKRSYTVPVFNFNGFSEKNPHDFTLSTSVTIPSLEYDFVSPVIPITDVTYDIEIDQYDIPMEVSDLVYAEVTSTIGVEFEYDQATMPLKSITLAAGSSITFPQWVILGDTPSHFNRISDCKVELKNDFQITHEHSSLSLPIAAIDFTQIPEGQGIIDSGHLYIKAETILSGGVIIKSSDCIAPGVYKPVVSTYLRVDPIEIKYLRMSKVDFGAEVNQPHTVQLSEILPEFIYEEGFTCDFNDLSLKINHYNGFPFSGHVLASIDTYTEGQNSPLRHYDFNFDIAYQLGINDDMVVHHYTESGKDGSIKTDGLNSILNPVPDYLQINTEINLDTMDGEVETNEDFGLIIPGSTYEFIGGYELRAPLSFGETFSLNLDFEINDIDLHITEVSLAEAHIKLNLVNTLPLNFDLQAQAIDSDGNELQHINAGIEGDIKGGNLNTPSVNPIVIKLTNNGELKIGGVRISLSASASEEGAVLNENQYVQFTDIRLILPKGIIYHVDGNNK